MKGLRMLGNRKVTIEQFEKPVLNNKGEVLVRVKASAICGSERKSYLEGSSSNNGHEVCGVVEEVYNTKNIQPGDHVGVYEIKGCGSCYYCLQGRQTWCSNRSSNVGWQDGCGGHAEYIKVKEEYCFKLPGQIQFSTGALLCGDALGVPYHANTKTAPVNPGETICVIGSGPIGLGNILVQTFLGAKVIAVDINPLRLQLASKCGSIFNINAANENVKETVLDFTNGFGVDKVFECIGMASTLKQAFEIVKPSGTIVCVGEQSDVAINISKDLIRRDITLKGSWFYHLREMPEMLKMYNSGLQIEKMHTGVFTLEKAQEAFDRFFDGKEGKVVLEI